MRSLNNICTDNESGPRHRSTLPAGISRFIRQVYIFSTLYRPTLLGQQQINFLPFVRLPLKGARTLNPMPAIPKKFSSFDKMLDDFPQDVVVVGKIYLDNLFGICAHALACFSQTHLTSDFYAKWCGPCKLMATMLEDFATENDNDVAVAKVDTDKYPSLGSRFEVEGLPTSVIFKSGVEVKNALLLFP